MTFLLWMLAGVAVTQPLTRLLSTDPNAGQDANADLVGLLVVVLWPLVVLTALWTVASRLREGRGPRG